MEEKRGMHRLAHCVVAPKRKGNVAYAAAHSDAGKILLNPAGRLDEIDRVIAMFFQTGRNGQNVRIKDDVVSRKICPRGQEFISPRADVDLALKRIGLAALIKSHHDDRCAILPNQPRLPEKFLLPVFQADGIDDRFALHAFQPRFDYAPLRAVDHEWNARDLWFAADQIQETRHRRFGIDHSLIHVYIEDVRSSLDLMTRNRERPFEIVS